MKKSILVVEDNKKLAQFIKESLIGAGYTVDLESRGDQAVHHILKKSPDMVILDIMLPEMDGKKICQTVRNDYRGKILMLTALNDMDSEVDSLHFGADNYLTKPVAESVLLAHIEALFRRDVIGEKVNNIEFGKLRINLIERNTYLDNTKIDLSPSEFELLGLLAKNADYCLNRDNIMYAISGREYDGISRSIDLRISSLRNKLKDNIKDPYKIKTIHGKGYMLVSSVWGGR